MNVLKNSDPISARFNAWFSIASIWIVGFPGPKKTHSVFMVPSLLVNTGGLWTAEEGRGGRGVVWETFSFEN